MFCRYFFRCYACLFCSTVTLKNYVLSFCYKLCWLDAPQRDVIVLDNLTTADQIYQFYYEITINMISVVSEYISSEFAVHDLTTVFGHFWLTLLPSCLKLITDMDSSTLGSGMRPFLWLPSFHFWWFQHLKLIFTREYKLSWF